MVVKPVPLEFGTTPWGKDWVRRVEPIRITRPNPLLPKGRSLARNKSVAIERVAPGTVLCTVSAGKFVESVTVTVPRYSKAQIRKVLNLRKAMGSLSHDSGDLPDELHTALVADALEPLPAETTAACTCSGRVEPCVHVVAATYTVALLIDQSPTKALLVRGLTADTYSSTVGSEPRRWIPIEEVDASAYFG